MWTKGTLMYVAFKDDIDNSVPNPVKIQIYVFVMCSSAASRRVGPFHCIMIQLHLCIEPFQTEILPPTRPKTLT